MKKKSNPEKTKYYHGEAQLTDAGSGFIWVIRPLHIIDFPKVPIGVEHVAPSHWLQQG